jgi:hypothetical protein
MQTQRNSVKLKSIESNSATVIGKSEIMKESSVGRREETFVEAIWIENCVDRLNVVFRMNRLPQQLLRAVQSRISNPQSEDLQGKECEMILQHHHVLHWISETLNGKFQKIRNGPQRIILKIRLRFRIRFEGNILESGEELSEDIETNG